MLKYFGLLLGKALSGIGIVTTLIFLFTSTHGLRGFAEVYMACAGVVTVVGGFMLMGAQGSQRDGGAHAMMMAGSPDLREQDIKERYRGDSAGLLTFFIGLSAIGFGYLLYSIP